MAQSVNIQPMPQFCQEANVGASLATRWANWQSDFEMFLMASGITDAKRQRALLLYWAGPRAREIFRQIPNNGTDEQYVVAKEKLKEYFDPQKNRRYEVYRFRKSTQEYNETLEQFHTRLRTIAQTCEFNDVDLEIEEQIIIGGTSSKIRKKALRDPNFDLKAMLLEGRDEQSEYQAKDIESNEQTEETTHQLDARPTQTCRNCGGTFPHEGGYPAKGKVCHKCGKENHFVKMCRGKFQQPRSTFGKSKQHGKPRNKDLNMLIQEENSDSDEGYLYTMTSENKRNAKVKVSPK